MVTSLLAAVDLTTKQQQQQQLKSGESGVDVTSSCCVASVSAAADVLQMALIQLQ